MEYKSDIFETDNGDVFRYHIFTQDTPGRSLSKVHVTNLPGLPSSLYYKFSYNFLKIKVFWFWEEWNEMRYESSCTLYVFSLNMIVIRK